MSATEPAGSPARDRRRAEPGGNRPLLDRRAPRRYLCVEA